MSKKHKRYAATQRKGFLSLMPNRPSANDSALKNLFQQCSKLTVDRFQDCLIRNELSTLIIDTSGAQPSYDLLQDVWNKVYIEFCQLSQNETYNELFEKSKEIDLLSTKVFLADEIVASLQLGYSKELVKILNELGLMCDLKPEHTGSAIFSKLNAVVGRAKKWVITIQQRKQDIEKLRQKGSKEMDDNYFDDWLDAIGKNNGVYVEASKMTVSRFCRNVNRIIEEGKKQEMKKLLNGR